MLISFEHLSSLLCKKVLFIWKGIIISLAGRFCFHVNTYRCYIFGTQSFFMLLDIDDIYLAPALTLFHTKTLLIQNFTLRLTHSSFNPFSFSSSFVLQCESARWKKVWLFWDLRPYLAQSSSKTEVSLNRRTNVF